jgi:hypothetical protein
MVCYRMTVLSKNCTYNIVGYWWPPTYSNSLLLIVFSSTRSSVILCNCGSTLLGLSEDLHNFQVYIGGRPPNPTSLFWKFSCQYIFLYFHGHFGALNNVFLVRLAGLWW